MKSLGIDWGHKEHVVALLEEDGSWSWCERIPAYEVTRLLTRLDQEGGAQKVAIGIEAAAPLLPETLVARGYRVVEVTPDRAQKMRALHFPGGSKDDLRDAKCAALMLEHEKLGLRGRHVPGPRAAELQLHTQARSRLVAKRTRAVQQLVGLVRRHHPGLAALDLDFTCGYALALAKAYADPLRARRAKLPKIARLLKKGRARKLDATTVQQRLCDHGFAIPVHAAAACALEVGFLVQEIELLGKQIKAAEKAIATCYESHEDASRLLAIGGMGPQLAPRISARMDASFVRRFSAKQTQILGGTAPYTSVSGKRHGGSIRRRKARDHDFHQAMIQFARCSLPHHEWARNFVRHHTGGRQRDRKSMNMALRALANKWVRILHTMLLRREHYDPERHAADLRRNAVPWAPTAKGAA
jgi:hypothetical protein